MDVIGLNVGQDCNHGQDHPTGYGFWHERCIILCAGPGIPGTLLTTKTTTEHSGTPVA